MRSFSSFGFGLLGARLPSAGWGIALFLVAMLTASAAAAHGGSHHGTTAAAASHGAFFDIATAGVALDAPASQGPEDPGCAHGPLHVFCAAAPSCCMAAADDAGDPMAHCIRLPARWCNAQVAGLAPPPLDRPPR